MTITIKEGTSKAKVYEAYKAGGAEKARTKGEKLGLASGTVSTWCSIWKRDGGKGKAKAKAKADKPAAKKAKAKVSTKAKADKPAAKKVTRPKVENREAA